MNITVVAFAALRDALGESTCVVAIPEAGTGTDLQETLSKSHPQYRDLIQACRMAKGVAFASQPVGTRVCRIFVEYSIGYVTEKNEAIMRVG